MYLPTWQEDMQGNPIISYDSYHRSCTVTGAEWGDLNELLLSSDTEVSQSGASYVKKKELTATKSGTLRVKFDLKIATAGDAYGIIRRNGVDVGTEQHVTSDTYATLSEDISGWAEGDLIQLWLHSLDGVNAMAQNLRVYGVTPGLTFDGTDDKTLVGTLALPENLTILARFKLDILATYRGILSVSDTDGYPGFQIAFDASGNFLSDCSTDGSNRRTWTSATGLSTNTWYRMKITQVGSTGTPVLRINGIAKAISLDTTAGTPTRPTQPWYIGALNGGTGHFFDGALPEILIFNKILTDAEEDQIWAPNNWRFPAV